MKLNNLENLDISGMKMDDYSWLSNFTKMKRLNISRTKIQDFSFLNNMAELEELHVGSTSITDLDFLKNLKNYNKLELLDISDTAVSDLDVISRFVNIRSLYISGCNNIHNFKPLYNLTNLDYFSYWGVQISDNDILEIIRCSIKKKNYSKGDLINIPLSYSILHGDGNLHIDVNGGDTESIEIKQNDSNTVKVLAKDKGVVELTLTLGNASVKTVISIKGADENPETGDNNDEEIMDFNTVAGISHTILTNNGDLWRVYPEAKKIRSNVRKYVSKWIYTIDQDSSEVVDYSLDNNDDLWSGNNKIQSNIKDVDGHYAITMIMSLLICIIIMILW